MLRRLPRVLTLRTTTLIVGALLTLACTPVELVSPSARASPARTLAVAEMLPTALHGKALVELPGVDPTTGALSQLVRRLAKTSADAEAAGRIAPDEGASRAFVQGVRIAGVDGATLLTEEAALIREILRREAQADVPADVISLGGRRVIRLVPPLADEPLYLLVSQDTIFLIGDADEPEADELIRQIP
jgi:hypothetical protein